MTAWGPPWPPKGEGVVARSSAAGAAMSVGALLPLCDDCRRRQLPATHDESSSSAAAVGPGPGPLLIRTRALPLPSPDPRAMLGRTPLGEGTRMLLLPSLLGMPSTPRPDRADARFRPCSPSCTTPSAPATAALCTLSGSSSGSTSRSAGPLGRSRTYCGGTTCTAPGSVAPNTTGRPGLVERGLAPHAGWMLTGTLLDGAAAAAGAAPVELPIAPLPVLDG